MSVSVSVCQANILVFYFSAIRRDIDLKCVQDTYRVVLNSLKNITIVIFNESLQTCIHTPSSSTYSG